MTIRTTVKPKPPRWTRLLAILAAISMTAVACGSAATEASDDGPQYGDSLEEWLKALDEESDSSGAAPAQNVNLEGYEKLEWEDLVPPGFSGDDIYARYEHRLNEAETGSAEADAIYEQMQEEQSTDAVNEELDGKEIQLAGFVAPLNFEDEVVTEFLLVPYFGACIHVPPPPPYQTIMVALDKADGMSLEDSWGAVWVAGTMTVDQASTDLAEASYTITSAQSGVYEGDIF